MPRSLVVPSPAKLNLILDVIRRREDGFHELKTIFERINLEDEITLSPSTSNRIELTCQHPLVPKDDRNLAYRMADLIRQHFGIKEGVRLQINKRIPVAAGLAGGSSNAAAVLLGLNQWWKLGLSLKELQPFAAKLGSDLNFFLYQTPFALGEGRGEKIEPLAIKTCLWHVTVTPKQPLLTKDVFMALKLKLTKKVDGVNILLPFLRQGDIRGVSGHLSNDLEPAILMVRPELKVLKEKLQRAGALGVCFSGSGPTVYAIADNKSHAQEIKARFDQRYAQVFIVSTHG